MMSRWKMRWIRWVVGYAVWYWLMEYRIDKWLTNDGELLRKKWTRLGLLYHGFVYMPILSILGILGPFYFVERYLHSAMYSRRLRLIGRKGRRSTVKARIDAKWINDEKWLQTAQEEGRLTRWIV